MRRLIVDAQVFQTPALYRGMGKYSTELVRHLVAINIDRKHWDTIELLLSSKLSVPDEVSSLIDSSNGNLTMSRINLKPDIVYKAERVKKFNRASLDQYIARNKKQTPGQSIDFLILSPLQGGISSTFPSDPSVNKCAIVYDLIPFMFHRTYYRNSIGRVENLTKLNELLKADAFLTISKTAANDLAVYLGVNPGRIYNINGAPVKHSTKYKKVDVPQPFILMPTGNDVRKNNRAGVLGFNEFNSKHNYQYSLVITSSFEASEISELSDLSPNVIFTGNVSGEEMTYLYKNCEALLFPSYYEGLGLPVIEAIEQKKPIACSDISVFREISRSGLTFLDPSLVTSIADAIQTAINSVISEKEYKEVLDKYTWEKTVKDTAQAIIDRRPLTNSQKVSAAIMSPSPAADLAISRLIQTAHSELARHLSINYFIETDQEDGMPELRPNLLKHADNAVEITQREPINIAQHKTIIYYLANSENCAKTLFTALANPGIVILYDLDLNRAWQGMLKNGLISESRLEVERKLQQQIEEESTTSMLCSVLAQQKAIGVFGDKAKEAISSLMNKRGIVAPIKVLNYPTASLVYDDIMPKRESTVVYINSYPSHDIEKFTHLEIGKDRKLLLNKPGMKQSQQIETVECNDDLTVERTLSQSSLLFAANSNRMDEILAGMRYGVIPILSETGNAVLNFPRTSLRDVESITLSTNSGKLEKIRKSAVTEIANEHSFALYADQLLELLEEVNKL